MSRSDSSVTARVVSLTRQYLAAPDDLAARLVLQALALEVAKLEVRARFLHGLASGSRPEIERATNTIVERNAFDVAMDALKRERSGLAVVP